MNNKIYSVSEINQYIATMFQNEYFFGAVFVQGEVSNCKYHSSGHIYFTIKDAKSQISCVMFAGDRRGMDFSMSDGQQVVVGGSLRVFERDGRYQLYAKKILKQGAGDLYEKFERLKKQLLNEGLFESEHKQEIPKFAHTVGIVTAQTGAAIRDMVQVAGRRNPYVQLILYPAKVQGDGAAQTIVDGIRTLDKMNLSTIIIGRGGGSIEDLWAFNEEIVARAVYECRTPIISAVGHETDTTIADYVADLRAPTPSAAAELAVFDYMQFSQDLNMTANRMTALMAARVERKYSELSILRQQLLKVNPENVLLNKKQAVADAADQLSRQMEFILTKKKHQFELLVSHLKGLSPLDKLSSGFSYVQNEQGKAVVSVNDICVGEQLSVHVTDGVISSTVTELKNVQL